MKKAMTLSAHDEQPRFFFDHYALKCVSYGADFDSGSHGGLCGLKSRPKIFET